MGRSTAETSVNDREPPGHRDRAIAAGALQRSDLATAEAAIRRQLLRDPDDVQGLEIAGDIAARRGDTERSIAMYQASVEKRVSPSEPVMGKLAQQLMVAGRAFDSLDMLETIVERFPASVQARSDLVGLATVLGMARRAVPSLRWLSQHGHGNAETIQVLADPQRVEPDRQACQIVLKRYPTDLRPQYALARLDARRLDWQRVAERLSLVLEHHREFVPAYTLQGLALTELNDFGSLPEWQRRAPQDAESSPEYWLVVGAWAEHQGNLRQAARAYWEAIRLDHTGHPQALSRLSRCLLQIGRLGDAEIVARQIVKQTALRDSLKIHFERSARSRQAAMQVADAMIDLGRLWEAEGWARLAVELPKAPLAETPLPDLRQRYLAIRSQLSADSPWQRPEMKLASRIDLSDLPEVDWGATVTAKTAASQPARGNVRLEDQAKKRGWIHTCEVEPKSATEGHWIYHSVGGGVGVVDFDLDGWPDLAAATLNGKPLQASSSPNRLFRNLGGQFADCTAQAGYLDRGFSQGITVGDFNDDGFPDIFDSNIGRNRLYQNNGDGTFQEVSSRAGLDGNVWTTSAAIADIDGDGIADLYEAAYCGGLQPYEQPCRNSSGVVATCPPLKFEAEKDRLWRGLGDGTFVDISQAWMNQSSPGRGLGVLVGLFDERPGLDLYIANDMTVNHLWSGQRDDPDGSGEPGFRLIDLAAIRGVGFSGRSLSQASMGMAAGDPDGDGDIDFFLTHFADDHNTYYEQVGAGLWIDRSSQVGLSQPSLKLLGFGTEWVDFDNDGVPELIVANGHVDDVQAAETAYRMPAQVFALDAGSGWVELDRRVLGDYFSGTHLGRALVTLDADRDGRTDIAITHLYEPVSLLMNRTSDAGLSIRLQLISTRGQRDAIGAIVTTTIGGQEVTAQLTAGDGYMCSNQRRISLGAGDARQADKLSVTWPSGRREEFGTLATGQDFLLVEGSGQAYPMRGKR